MVSPPKIRNQKQKPVAKDNKKADDKAHVRLHRGDKPLSGKSYYLDTKNHGVSSKLEAKIKDLGGSVEVFLVKSVTLVVSDRTGKCGDKGKWGYASGGSVEPPSLRSIEAQTPIQTPPTPSLSGECPLSNSTNTRVQASHRIKSRVEAMLERALTQPQKCSVDPLDNAQNWGIPIWSTTNFQIWLEKIYASLKNNSSLKCIRRNSSTDKDKVKVKEFNRCYIKFESFKRETRPVFFELPVWPGINPDGEPGSCPFDRRKKEPAKLIEQRAEQSGLKKDMTRRSRAIATRARRSEQLVAGYCEICRIDYRDLNKHIQTEKHLAFVKNDDNFLSLDSLINSGASVEAFLKLNQTKDVGSDLFTNGNRKLHGVVIETAKAEKTIKSEISEFADLKMVQCNGARRKVNLKLNSPHNLRARTKHESGHLLRSKGSPWHEIEKPEKFYEKFDGFTIKKRAKGTIWIEEDDNEEGEDAEDEEEEKADEAKEKAGDNHRRQDHQHHNLTKTKCCTENNNKDSKCTAILEEKIPLSELNDGRVKNKESRLLNYRKTQLSKVDEKKSKRNNSDSLEKEQKITTEENNSKNKSSPNNHLVSKIINGNCRLSNNVTICEKQTTGRILHPNGSLKSIISNFSNSINEPAEINNEEPKETDGLMEDNESNKIKCNPKLESVDKHQEDKSKIKQSKRGTRSMRTRQRLSVEERLIEDNRAYYKVEVLGCKLRSSTVHWSSNSPSVTSSKQINSTVKDAQEEEQSDNEQNGDNNDDKEVQEVVKNENQPSSEKPVVVRFKRVRKSELSLLSDEAESFMFGDARRDGSFSDTTSQINEDDTTSILPDETESDYDGKNCSSIILSSPIKPECIQDDDSQDSVCSGRAKKRRRTQAEALIKDNEDYYKFETPGSRLRFQGASTGGKDQLSSSIVFDRDNSELAQVTSLLKCEPSSGNDIEKLYPSKPSAEVEKMKFSFESIPKSEPWYQTYQRQDEGAEFWHYSSESEWRKPFLLPYEIENFHENLVKLCQKNEARKKNRNQAARGINGFGRSPRKSPRCHASTLAIMSTIIRKREQQQSQTPSQSQSVNADEDHSSSRTTSPKPDNKSSTDLELQRMAKSIDDMLNAETGPIDDSFEIDSMTTYVEKTAIEEEQDEIAKNPTTSLVIPGAPENFLELLDNCHKHLNGIENSSCASSECGEILIESPLKRRKRRKNRTGWPGNKIRRRLQTKPTATCDADSSDIQNSTKENESMISSSSSSSRINGRPAAGDVNSGGAGVDDDDEDDDSEVGACEQQGDEGEEGDHEQEDEEDENEQMDDEGKGDNCKNPNYREKTSDITENSTSNSDRDKTSNDENQVDVYRNNDTTRTPLLKQQVRSKLSTRSRQSATRASSSENLHFHLEIDSKDCIYRKKNPPTIISRKNYTNRSDLCNKQKQMEQVDQCEMKNSCVNATEENNIDNLSEAKCEKKECNNSSMGKRKSRNNKRQHKSSSGDSTYNNKNCEKNCLVSSGMAECALAERMSSSSCIQESDGQQQSQRRSSIEFQPVVRVMKIEDQVDMDHSILSVTVVSNRRLRSSSSPRPPPPKRFRRTRDPFGRWRKES